MRSVILSGSSCCGFIQTLSEVYGESLEDKSSLCVPATSAKNGRHRMTWMRTLTFSFFHDLSAVYTGAFKASQAPNRPGLPMTGQACGRTSLEVVALCKRTSIEASRLSAATIPNVDTHAQSKVPSGMTHVIRCLKLSRSAKSKNTRVDWESQQ